MAFGYQDVFERNYFHWHEHFELILILGNDLDFYVDGAVHRMKNGEILLIYPYSMHCAMPVEGENEKAIVISFDEKFFLENVNKSSIILNNAMTNKVVSVRETADFDNSIGRSMIPPAFSLKENFLKDRARIIADENDAVIKSFILMLLSIVEFYGREISLDKPEAEKNSTAEEKIKTVCNYLEKHVDESITIEEMAEMSHYSVSHFNRIFKSVIGCTYKQYTDYIKIKAAKRYMNVNGMSITEASYRLGYSHPNNFSRVYKRITGFAPTEDLHNSEDSFEKQLNGEK